MRREGMSELLEGIDGVWTQEALRALKQDS